jgi:xanthine dehydrogenase accessory factor
MTHDHGLDQRLCEQILRRDDFAYFGLIGSQSKRRNFETRMRRRGIDPRGFERMTCPIGIGGISSKQPAQIAISVAAEILRVYDQARRLVQQNNNSALQRGGRA